MFFKKTYPIVRERKEHCLSRANIDPEALKVLYRLVHAGYTAYLVGGSVRDLLMGRQPKDFDISTNARPNEIRRLFRNCFLIGRRFRLAHIVFGRKIIETSTFRRQPDPNDGDGNSGIYQTEDNTFGSPEEDAKRRDFTVNGLFYDPQSFSVIDYVGGIRDLEKRVLRSIGDPEIRFREDPVRMMRAVKFAARLDFSLDRACRKAMLKHHADILNASVPRVCEEVFRLFTYGTSRTAFRLCWEYKLLGDLLPELDAFLTQNGGAKAPLWNVLAALDADPQTADLTNGVRAACLFYPLFQASLAREEARHPRGRVNRQHVARLVLQPLAHRLHVPKATLYSAIALLDAGRRLAEPPQKGRSPRFLHHPAFPEALAFYRIITVAEKGDRSRLDAWQALYDAEVARHEVNRPHDQPIGDEVNEPRDAESDPPPRARRRRRRKPRKDRDAAAPTQPSRHPGRSPAVTVTEVSSAEDARTDGCE